MGSLGGHLLPGSFFIIFAIWWGFITALRYVQLKGSLRTRKQNGVSANGGHGAAKTSPNKYHSSVWMPCICLPCGPRIRRAPIESWLKAVLAFIALVIEAYTAVSFQVRPLFLPLLIIFPSRLWRNTQRERLKI